MNLKQINEFRVSQGLIPLESKTDRAQKIRQDHNRQARAESNRSIKARRQGRTK